VANFSFGSSFTIDVIYYRFYERNRPIRCDSYLNANNDKREKVALRKKQQQNIRKCSNTEDCSTKATCLIELKILSEVTKFGFSLHIVTVYFKVSFLLPS